MTNIFRLEDFYKWIEEEPSRALELDYKEIFTGFGLEGRNFEDILNVTENFEEPSSDGKGYREQLKEILIKQNTILKNYVKYEISKIKAERERE